MKMHNNNMFARITNKVNYFTVGMLQGLADCFQHNQMFYFVNKNKNMKQFLETETINEQCVDSKVVDYFVQIANEIKTVWGTEKPYNQNSGFDFFYALYFNEWEDEDLTKEQLALYQKYSEEFDERIINGVVDNMLFQTEFKIVFD